MAEHLDDSGAVTEAGISRLETFLVQAKSVAADKGCAMVLAFATSAVRDSPTPTASWTACSAPPASTCRFCPVRTRRA
ncbi:MAG: hypothetical protein WKF83_15730 [Nocardioidaceae bacterium]